MITERTNIRMDSTFSDDRKHRFLLRRSWAKEGKIATVIMINPSDADYLITDVTTMSVYNGLARLGEFAAVNIVNLYSMVTPKISFKYNTDDELTKPENDKTIQKVAAESDVVLLCWGSVGDTNGRVAKRIMTVLDMLRNEKEKMHVLTYGDKEGLHPLVPQMRNVLWKFKQIDFDSYYESYNYGNKEKDTKEVKQKDSKATKVSDRLKETATQKTETEVAAKEMAMAQAETSTTTQEVQAEIVAKESATTMESDKDVVV